MTRLEHLRVRHVREVRRRIPWESTATSARSFTCGILVLWDSRVWYCDACHSFWFYLSWLFRWNSWTQQRRSLIRKHLEETEEKQEEVRKEIELMQKAWQINWDRIRIGKKIAAGGQGVVYQGTFKYCITRNTWEKDTHTNIQTGTLQGLRSLWKRY